MNIKIDTFKAVITAIRSGRSIAMMEWKKLNPGDKVIYSWNEFDGCGSLKGTVTKVHDDHVIINANGQNLWIDDDNSHMIEWDIMDNL